MSDNENRANCGACRIEAAIGTEEVPHPIDGRLHTCVSIGIGRRPHEFSFGSRIETASEMSPAERKHLEQVRAALAEAWHAAHRTMTKEEFQAAQDELNFVANTMVQIADKLRIGDVRGARVRLERALEAAQKIEREQCNDCGMLCDPGV